MSVMRQIRLIGKEGEERADQLVRALVAEVDRRVRERTPVDTGHAKGNWNVATGAPDDTVIQGRVEGPGPAELHEPPPSVRMGGVHYITNAVPYIEALEFGHSKQAPNGMVRVVAVEIEPLVEEIVMALERGQ